jgi:YD repeat-containing protein
MGAGYIDDEWEETYGDLGYYDGFAYNANGAMTQDDCKVYPYCLSERIDSIYDLNGNYLTKTIVKYEHNDHNLLQDEKVININDTIKSVFKYIFDHSTDDINTAFGQMASLNIFTPVIEQYEYKNSTLLSGIINNYANMSNGIYAPNGIFRQKGNNPQEQRITISKYDSRGHPVYVIMDDMEKIVNLWSYNYQYPIVEIKGATLIEVMNALNYAFSMDLEVLAVQSNPDIGYIDNQLRNYFAGKSVQIASCTYKFPYGVATIKDPRGVTTTYEYDDFGRLKTVKDNEGKTIEDYKYHYKN